MAPLNCEFIADIEVGDLDEPNMASSRIFIDRISFFLYDADIDLNDISATNPVIKL